jgi:hypothetical protein
MANLERDFQTQRAGVSVALESAPALADAVQYAGLLAMLDTDGYLVGATASADPTDICIGTMSKAIDNTDGSSGDIKGQIELASYYYDIDATNPITQDDLFRTIVYRVDNHTVGTSDVGGTLAPVGIPIRMGSSADNTSGKVAVLPYFASINAPLPASAQGFVARLVATNLEAGAFSGGVFTATANGALATQDSVAPAVGDVIILPAGTLTTLVVSAANSGPYVVTSLGGASAKVTLARPAWWRHANGVPLGAEIRGAAGTIYSGTTWRSFVTTGTVVIGTSDPALYPLEVTQRITLAAGTYTISNVPVRLAARLGFSCSGAVAGTAAATTTNFAISATNGITIGGIGTAAVIVEAQSVSDTIVNTDVSVINVTLSNR